MLWQKGHLALGTYAGWYSVPDETFFKPEDTVERDGATYLANPSVDQTKAPLEWVEETTHFFRLSQFQDRLIEYYQAHPEVLQPTSRRNEVMSFLRSGLDDVSISRELDWGISLPSSVPSHENHSIYVWFEALINYISAPGFGNEDALQREHFEQFWPCDLHLMSKDIFTRFHATMWPAMLLALDLPLPKQLFAHGFWTVDGRKMSKRDPETIVEPVSFAREIAMRRVRLSKPESTLCVITACAKSLSVRMATFLATAASHATTPTGEWAGQSGESCSVDVEAILQQHCARSIWGCWFV
jgi:methionyl-tRNA synthetase